MKQWSRDSSNAESLTEDRHLSKEQKEERLTGENPGWVFQAEESIGKGTVAGTNVERKYYADLRILSQLNKMIGFFPLILQLGVSAGSHVIAP